MLLLEYSELYNFSTFEFPRVTLKWYVVTGFVLSKPQTKNIFFCASAPERASSIQQRS